MARPSSPAPSGVLPYGRQSIDDDDVRAVVAVLRSDYLTTGPEVDAFERAFAERLGVADAVAVANGTAALHAAVHALGIGPGDEVLVPAMTFAATANAVAFEGGIPVFADVDPDTLLIDAEKLSGRVSERTRAVIAVDYAGQPCDYDTLGSFAASQGLSLIADACHSLGGAWRGRPVGTLARLNTFSFHPVKPVTTAEGGMVTTAEPELAAAMRRFRNHGIRTGHAERAARGTWFYEMEELGYNYRLSDLHAALGRSQLAKLDAWIERRRAIAHAYDEAFADLPTVAPLGCRAGAAHAYHLYVLRIATACPERDREVLLRELRQRGVGGNVHYIPVHLHPFYRRRFGTGPGLCPVAEEAYRRLVTVPIFPAMTDADVARVVGAVRAIAAELGR